MRIWLSIEDRDALLAEAARATPNETGGVLVGYRADGHDLVVTAVVGPGPNAVEAAISFLPDHEYQDAEIAHYYQDSGRINLYLGDWHTHPGGSCELSWRDRRTLRVIARSAEARVPEPLMLVLAGGPIDWTFTAYRHRKHLSFPSVLRLPVRFFTRNGSSSA